EFITAAGAEEGMMQIREGSYASFAEDLREAELAIIRPRDDGREDVVPIPQARLVAAEDGGPIDLSPYGVPLTVRVLDWMPNSGLAGPQMLAQAGDSLRNPATAGHG